MCVSKAEAVSAARVRNAHSFFVLPFYVGHGLLHPRAAGTGVLCLHW